MGAGHRIKVWDKGGCPYLAGCSRWGATVRVVGAKVPRAPPVRLSLHPEGNLVFGGAMARGE